MKIIPSENVEIPPFIRIYQQFQYINTGGINAVQGIGGDRICDKQSLALCSPSGTILTIDNLNPGATTITKNGYQCVAAADIYEAKAQFNLANDEWTASYNNLLAIYEQEFSNMSITHNIQTANNADIFIGYYQIVKPMNM